MDSKLHIVLVYPKTWTNMLSETRLFINQLQGDDNTNITIIIMFTNIGAILNLLCWITPIWITPIIVRLADYGGLDV